ANVVRSEVLSASTAMRHGIERASDRAVLNLVILERQGKRQVTLPARVTASTHNLIGQSEAIEMRAIRANGRVSYFVTFGFAPLRNFRITMTALPVGTNEPLEIEFEVRLLVPPPMRTPATTPAFTLSALLRDAQAATGFL
ncbi:MAG: DUF4426 domain-containing protein, partial [Polaromonas sp.]|nr:DUF4426 domain-containing protein [Polaromonas sp.]